MFPVSSPRHWGEPRTPCQRQKASMALQWNIGQIMSNIRKPKAPVL